jgi:CRISPR/Cas system-associated endonuclease/helicase Cas3
MSSVAKQRELKWRRVQVLELSSRGYNQREISNKLQVDPAAINRDIQFLRQQAQASLQKHIHEVVPEEYQKCMVVIVVVNTMPRAQSISNTISNQRA